MAKSGKSKITKFDAAEYLDSPKMVAAYLSGAFETKDKVFISEAFSTVMRSKGMTKIAKKAGASRESLYKSFDGKTDASFVTVQKVLDALESRAQGKAESACRVICGYAVSELNLFAEFHHEFRD